jgi:hypothetical protein
MRAYFAEAAAKAEIADWKENEKKYANDKTGNKKRYF